MSKVRKGNRIIIFEHGKWTTTIGGKKKTFNKYSQLDTQIRIYESERGKRKGKKILEMYRKKQK